MTTVLHDILLLSETSTACVLCQLGAIARYWWKNCQIYQIHGYIGAVVCDDRIVISQSNQGVNGTTIRQSLKVIDRKMTLITQCGQLVTPAELYALQTSVKYVAHSESRHGSVVGSVTSC